MRALRKIYDVFTKVERYCLFAIVFFATVAVVVNVIGRKFFGFSFNWLEELNRYILIICTFVGSAIATTQGLHPRMDMVVSLFKGRKNTVYEIVSAVILTVFLALMTFYAFKQLGTMVMFGAMTATLKVPVYVFFAFIPIGFCGMTVRSLVHLILLFMKLKNPETPAEPAAEEERS